MLLKIMRLGSGTLPPELGVAAAIQNRQHGVCRGSQRDTPPGWIGCGGGSAAPRQETADPDPAPGFHTSEPQRRDHLWQRIGVGEPRSERLLNRIEHRIGIAVLGVALLGSDGVPQGLDQLQAFRQGQGQQVIHHRPCQPPLGEQEGTAVVFCGTQLDSAGLGLPVTLRFGAGQGDAHQKLTDTERR